MGVLTGSARGASTPSEARRRSTREAARGESKASWGWRSTNTGRRASEADRQAAASGLADTRARGKSGSCARSSGAKSGRGVGRRRSFNRTRDNLSTAHDSQAEASLLFRFDQRGVCGTGSGLGFPLDATEFFCVGKN